MGSVKENGADAEKPSASETTARGNKVSKLIGAGRAKGLRVTVGLVIIALAVWTFYPGIFAPVGTRAIMNARVLTVRAPISGEVTALSAREGVLVESGQLMGTILNKRSDPSRLERLRTEAAAFAERTQVLEEKIEMLKALQTRLGSQLQEYQEVVVSHYERRIQETEAIRAARRAEVAKNDAHYGRQKALHAKKLTSEQKVDTVKREAQVSRAELAEVNHVLERLSGELAAARQGIFLADGFNNVPYSQQRMDEIAVTLSSTQSEMDEAQIRRRELEREIEIEQKRYQLLSRANLVAPHTGPVWRKLVNEGEFVEAGTPLLEIVDQSEVFLLVQLDVRHFDKLSQGDRATIELLGSDDSLEGRVVNLRGGRAIHEQNALAVQVPEPEQREFRVVVGVDADHLNSKVADFLKVGRVARVRIHPEKGSFSLFSEAKAEESDAEQIPAVGRPK